MLKNSTKRILEETHKKERYGKRDLKISMIHRLCGNKIYATDIDFMEYKILNNDGIPVALLELKRKNGSNQKEKILNSINTKAIINLGNLAHLPTFLIIYSLDYTLYNIIPLNTYAQDIIKESNVDLLEFAKFEYSLRNIEIPKTTKECLIDLITNKCDLLEFLKSL